MSAPKCDICGARVAPGQGLQQDGGELRPLCQGCVAEVIAAAARPPRINGNRGPSIGERAQACTDGRLARHDEEIASLRRELAQERKLSAACARALAELQERIARLEGGGVELPA